MQTVMQHDTYGTITYDEGFWTGKRTVTVGGVPLKKIDRKHWECEWNGVALPASIKGNTMTGVTLTLGEENITIVPRPAWYVLTMSILTLVFIIAWGSSVELVKIFPIFGGAVGGLIAGVGAVFNLYFAGKAEKAWQKLLIGICAFAAAVIATHILAVMYLGAHGAL